MEGAPLHLAIDVLPILTKISVLEIFYLRGPCPIYKFLFL